MVSDIHYYYHGDLLELTFIPGPSVLLSYGCSFGQARHPLTVSRYSQSPILPAFINLRCVIGLSSGFLAIILFISGIILLVTSSLTSRIQSNLKLKDERVPLPRPTLSYSDFSANRRALVRQMKKFLPIMMLLWSRIELYEYIIKHTRCSSLPEFVC